MQTAINQNKSRNAFKTFTFLFHVPFYVKLSLHEVFDPHTMCHSCNWSAHLDVFQANDQAIYRFYPNRYIFSIQNRKRHPNRWAVHRQSI